MARTQLSRSVRVKAWAQLWLLISKNSGEETEGEGRHGTQARTPGLGGLRRQHAASAYQPQSPQRALTHAHSWLGDRSSKDSPPGVGHQGLTYLLVSRCNRNQVHVVETHHVDDPHLLVVELLDLVKLARGRAEDAWAGEACLAGHAMAWDPVNPLPPPEALEWATALVWSPALPPATDRTLDEFPNLSESQFPHL